MLAMLHRLELLARVHGTIPALPELVRSIPSAALKHNVLVWRLLFRKVKQQLFTWELWWPKWRWVPASIQMRTLKAEVEKGSRRTAVAHVFKSILRDWDALLTQVLLQFLETWPKNL